MKVIKFPWREALRSSFYYFCLILIACLTASCSKNSTDNTALRRISLDADYATCSVLLPTEMRLNQWDAEVSPVQAGLDKVCLIIRDGNNVWCELLHRGQLLFQTTLIECDDARLGLVGTDNTIAIWNGGNARVSGKFHVWDGDAWIAHVWEQQLLPVGAGFSGGGSFLIFSDREANDFLVAYAIEGAVHTLSFSKQFPQMEILAVNGSEIFGRKSSDPKGFETVKVTAYAAEFQHGRVLLQESYMWESSFRETEDIFHGKSIVSNGTIYSVQTVNGDDSQQELVGECVLTRQKVALPLDGFNGKRTDIRISKYREVSSIGVLYPAGSVGGRAIWRLKTISESEWRSPSTIEFEEYLYASFWNLRLGWISKDECFVTWEHFMPHDMFQED